METFLIVFVIVLVVVVGNAMILYRTAKKPRIPGSVKPKPHEDDAGNGW